MYGSRPKENSHAITNCGQRVIYQRTNAGAPECLSSNEIIYLWKPMPVLGPRPIYQAWEACGIAPGPLTFHLFPLVLQDETLPLVLLPSSVHLPTECKCKTAGLWNNSKAMDQGQVTNLCHWHCDLCRQFVTHEPGDLCDITEKNSTGDQRWASARSE